MKKWGNEMTAQFIVAEDNKLLRETIVQILRSSGDGLHLVGEAKDGVEAIEMVEQHVPDLLVLDLQMPRLDGFSVIKKIRARHPDLKILVMTMSQNNRDLKKALQNGTNGYCTKISGRNEFLVAVEQVLLGNQYICSDMQDS
jgi:DNA-binding NarL/FixJ family response regulator